jgi:hypothetical protein
VVALQKGQPLGRRHWLNKRLCSQSQWTSIVFPPQPSARNHRGAQG